MFTRHIVLALLMGQKDRGVLKKKKGRAKKDAAILFTGDSYFIGISLPQHCWRTRQTPSSPALQLQVFSTRSSRPQASHTNRSPSFISAQSAIPSTPYKGLICGNKKMRNRNKKHPWVKKMNGLAGYGDLPQLIYESEISGVFETIDYKIKSGGFIRF